MAPPHTPLPPAEAGPARPRLLGGGLGPARLPEEPSAGAPPASLLQPRPSTPGSPRADGKLTPTARDVGGKGLCPGCSAISPRAGTLARGPANPPVPGQLLPLRFATRGHRSETVTAEEERGLAPSGRPGLPRGASSFPHFPNVDDGSARWAGPPRRLWVSAPWGPTPQASRFQRDLRCLGRSLECFPQRGMRARPVLPCPRQAPFEKQQVVSLPAFKVNQSIKHPYFLWSICRSV